MEPTTDLNHKLTDDATRLGEGGSDVAGGSQTCAKETWNSVQRKTHRAVCESSAYIHKNPLPIALAAFGFGLVMGLFLSRRYPVSFKHRYIEESPHQSRSMPVGLIIACITLLRSILFLSPRGVKAGAPVREEHPHIAPGYDAVPEEALARSVERCNSYPH